MTKATCRFMQQSYLSNLIFKVLFFLSINTFSQERFTFSHISVNDGLSQSDVNAIYQSKDGYMWFGTHDGLNKFDGYQFKHYKPSEDKNSLNSNLIFRITGDENSNLWIGTTGNGLNFLNTANEKVTHYTHNPLDSTSIRNNYIGALLLDRDHQLWIGTNDGLDLVDLKASQKKLVFQHLDFPIPLNNKKVNVIYQSKKGDLLLGTNKYLFQIIKKGTNYVLKPINKEYGIPNGAVKVITEDLNNRMIISSAKGLYVENIVPKIKKKFIRFHANMSTSGIAIDNQNNIWVGTSRGLIHFENNIPKPVKINVYKDNPDDPNSINKNIISSIYKDSTGIMWVGTNGGGINILDPIKKPFLHIKSSSNPKSLSYNKIRAIFSDSNETLWIGTEGGTLNKEIKTKNKYKKFLHLFNNTKTFAIAEIQAKNKKFLLFGNEGGISLSYIDITDNNKKDYVKKSIPLPVRSSVFSLLVDHKNQVWVGTYSGGVFMIALNEKQEFVVKKHFKHQPDNPNSIGGTIIRNIYEDSKKNLWFATGTGLSKLNYQQIAQSSPKFINYKHQENNPKSLSLDYILSIHESKKGELWIGTFGGGLNKMITPIDENEAQFKTYTKKEGLPNNVIKGILEDNKGNLWISTNNGISKFNPEKEIFKNYNIYDGLQSNEFQELACFKRKDGEMIFGGINGFSAFYPNKIKDNPYAPKTAITKISLFNNELKPGEKVEERVILKQSIDKTKKLTFTYDQNSISFEFAALQYSSPLKNQYAYKLTGFENRWNYTQSNKRFATYTNLSPGTYVFHVKSSNGDGVWNNDAKKIVIEITPPFWKTMWAYIIYALLIVLSLLGFWKFTLIRSHKKHTLELQKIEQNKYQELQQMKMEFFTNISHEFRTPLTLIKGPLEYLQKKGESLDFNAVKNQYTLMEKNTEYLLRLVKQLLDFQKLDKGKMDLVVYEKNIAKFVKEVAEPFKFIGEKKKINYTVRSESDSIYSYFSPDALEKVMNNLLSNAFKFCPDGGIVDVYVYVKKTYHSDRLTKGAVYNRVVIEVKDSGSGISEAKKQRIFNRFYSNSAKELANPTGTGIGLSYTKSLIDLHQGSIAVVDNEYGGTTFAVNLPQEKQAYIDKPNINFGNQEDGVSGTSAYVASAHQVAVKDEEEDKEQIIKKRPELPMVLVVDDNSDIRQFIRQSLQENYNILEAEDGKKGFEIAQKQIPNIIISDYVMPEMDGVEFCIKCKETSETSHIPFILLTAKTSQENEQKGLESGADDYITKPFNLEALQLKIKNIISKRSHLRKRFNQEIILKPEEVTVTSADEIFLQKAMDVVEKNMMNTEFSVEMLVKEMNVSRSNLYLKLKEITGLSSSEFIRSIRLKRAVQLLETSDLSVKEIMYMTGFNSPSYFAKCFKKQFEMTPSEYISKNNIDIKK
ncbi:two-component regulator propeller domain-containing protein [Ochrovirga pacifica]|uniref:two-component regulator propeller domain-containing protein n=1 Tax=Ochrovirga pacifica TaxID=1042376 RepID=UPI0002559AB6|nr:two-component regulator propeller domain-containing protein [Ochrovirga pacifica]